MRTYFELVEMVKKANMRQLSFMIYELEQLGFYRKDKRVKRKFILRCLLGYNGYLKSDFEFAWRIEKIICNGMER